MKKLPEKTALFLGGILAVSIFACPVHSGEEVLPRCQTPPGLDGALADLLGGR